MSSFSKLLVLAASAVALQGCSVVSPVPVLELVKATGAVAVSAISTGPSHSRNTVYHEHKSLDAVCVEYNPLTPDPDIAPALQAELRNHEIDSRIYEEGGTPANCRFRVTYTADIEWDTPPLNAMLRSPATTRLPFDSTLTT